MACAMETHYSGVTRDLNARLVEHDRGKCPHTACAEVAAFSAFSLLAFLVDTASELLPKRFGGQGRVALI